MPPPNMKASARAHCSAASVKMRRRLAERMSASIRGGREVWEDDNRFRLPDYPTQSRPF